MQPAEARALTKGLHHLRAPNRRKPEYAIADVEQEIRNQIVSAMRPMRMEMKMELIGCSDPRNDLSDTVRNMLDNLRLQLSPPEIVCSTEDLHDFHDYKRVPDVMGIISDAVTLLRQKVQNDFWKKKIEVTAREEIRNLHTGEREQRDSQMSIYLANHVFYATEANMKQRVVGE